MVIEEADDEKEGSVGFAPSDDEGAALVHDEKACELRAEKRAALHAFAQKGRRLTQATSSVKSFPAYLRVESTTTTNKIQELIVALEEDVSEEKIAERVPRRTGKQGAQPYRTRCKNH